MKKLIISTFVLSFLAFGGVSAFAQCDRSSNSPIRCGYYDEGYQDGASDATNNRNSDYRRFRNKFENLYENMYKAGYEAGYASVRPTNRWTSAQRNAYDSGYTQGQNDRRRSNSVGRPDMNAQNRYDQNIGLYYQQGYNDGFNNRQRQYDVAVGGNNYPPYPFPPNTGGGAAGTATWSGRVDDRVNLTIRGGNISATDASGTGMSTSYQNMNGTLPRRNTQVTATKLEGRGDVIVTQQPNRSNDYTAIVQVIDSRGGSDNYRVEITWASPFGGAEEPYRSGSVSWRGRVDQTANIVINGADVDTQDASGTGISGVNFSINGALSRRPGTVSVNKRRGRGTVTVLQQPSRDNDYTAIVQVFDPNAGSDNYELEITW